MSSVHYTAPMGVPQPGTATYGGGGRTDIVGARSILDAKRMMATGRTPTAEYPDGYAGTVNSRRSERLGDQSLSSRPMRQAQKNYTRGVHKGERVDPGDYLWPPDLNPMTALEHQARGKKWTQHGTQPADTRLVGTGVMQKSDPDRIAALRNLRSPWR